ncbi:beta-hexosaminidase [Algicella marina]|uniref:beta-N-acetylhexosaminidase n=2 Tax=Algicella marina TaxID=2683284 RepID=A0A6P1T6F6_9RHOB|nr:glycoside hydrolase family 3 N-terminal domain-containing protein [Algicella marina]QHQ37270.1 beta-hexosaminidase [Algicella marina]
MSAARAAIFGCTGPVLEADERAFLREADPWGFILFARNLETPEQIRALTSELRATVGRNAPILIDQEGGRVARLLPPHWTGWEDALPFVARFSPEAGAEAMRLRYHVIGTELRALGIDVNCAPMADIAQPDTHPVVRTRCYGTDAGTVAQMARAVTEGLALGGVLPILKHIPGHGRTDLDSHADLPVVHADAVTLNAEDFAPFRDLADLPMAMTAHVVYPAHDAENCATWSPKMISLIRETIGFDGLLMSDDISMHALTGTMDVRVSKALDAGCDIILHCNGERDEMAAIAAVAPRLEGDALRRAEAALAARTEVQPIDVPATLARIEDLKEAAHAR